MAADSFGDFTCYFRGAFFGRDAGSKEIKAAQRRNKDDLLAGSIRTDAMGGEQFRSARSWFQASHRRP